MEQTVRLPNKLKHHFKNRDRAWWLEQIFSLKKSRKMLVNRSGSALMLALFTVTLLMAVAMEIMYESNVESQVSANTVNDVKAYYAAKSGVEISLLRILIYKKAMAAFGQSLPDKTMLDVIWNMPFTWPPTIPKDLDSVDKDEIKSTAKKSAMKSSYIATIESEGSKIDVNDLASPSLATRKIVHTQLVNIFKSRIESDDKFSEQYRSFDFEALVNNIQDFIDEDHDAVGGGEESRAYPNLSAKERESIPPNRPLQSIQELHEVATMTDEFYDMLAPRLTIFGAKGINVNYASADVLMSLDARITKEIADKIVARRSDPNQGPFKNMQDFVGYLNSTEIGIEGNPFVDRNGQANNGQQQEVTVPLVFDPEINFRVESIGTSGKVQHKIIAIVYDYDAVKARLSDQIKQANPTPPAAGNQAPPPVPGAPTPTPTPTPGTTTPSGTQNNGRPNVVYWYEE